MIHLTLVSQALQDQVASSADLVVEDQAGYPAAYQRIQQAIYAGQALHVLVKDRNVGRWLKVMAQRYGSDAIHLQELTLHQQIRNQVGVDVPPDLSEDGLLKSGLLDLNIPAQPNTSFENYLLEVFFGNFLILPGGMRRVGEIIASYDPEQWQSALQRPLVKDIYQSRVRQLRQELKAAGQVAELQLLDWLDQSPDMLIRNLSALKLLAGYPERLGKKVLGALYPELLKLKLDLHRVPVVMAGNEKALDEIRLYLTKKAASTEPTAFGELLEEVSGLLDIEFESLQKMLLSGVFPITAEWVRRVQGKFHALTTSPRIAQALADLDLLISQPAPPAPSEAWEADEWIAWSRQHYLPYRFWLENTGKLDDHIGEIASAYADWLYRHYGQLIYHSEHMAWKSVLNLKDAFKAYPGPLLVVMIDNLNFKFYPEFQTQMQQQGYYERSLSYCFSMLPSCTAVSKKCLLAGHYAPFPETAYAAPVEKIWSDRLGKKVRYVANIGEFRAITRREHDAYFLNYLPLDITLHSSEQQTGISHAQAIRAYLAALTQDIRSFAQRISAERDLMVVVLSDHGSTRIPRGTVNVIHGAFYKQRAVDEHHRYIAVSDDELEKLPKNSEYDCYIFSRQVYELDANYLVARRLYRFLPTDENSYIHGGLTPEETLVPLAVYYPVTVSPKPLDVHLVRGGKLYLGTKVDLTMEITNFNKSPCEEVLVEFTDPNIEIGKQAPVPVLQPLDRISLPLSGRCPRAADVSARKLHLHITYRFLGQPWENKIELPVEIIDPARPKADLDNL